MSDNARNILDEVLSDSDDEVIDEDFEFEEDIEDDEEQSFEDEEEIEEVEVEEEVLNDDNDDVEEDEVEEKDKLVNKMPDWAHSLKETNELVIKDFNSKYKYERVKTPSGKYANEFLVFYNDDYVSRNMVSDKKYTPTSFEQFINVLKSKHDFKSENVEEEPFLTKWSGKVEEKVNLFDSEYLEKVYKMFIGDKEIESIKDTKQQLFIEIFDSYDGRRSMKPSYKISLMFPDGKVVNDYFVAGHSIKKVVHSKANIGTVESYCDNIVNITKKNIDMLKNCEDDKVIEKAYNKIRSKITLKKNRNTFDDVYELFGKFNLLNLFMCTSFIIDQRYSVDTQVSFDRITGKIDIK